MPIKITYRNRLPHIAPIGATFFVTFRLADSLPWHVVLDLREKMEHKVQKLKDEKPPGYEQQIINTRKLFFAKYDRYLDNPQGKCYLRKPAVANAVKEILHQHDEKLYSLHAYCIMPNHVHILIDTSVQIHSSVSDEFLAGKLENEDYTQLDAIMKRVKGASARKANQILEREGKFWFKDSYDHYLRGSNQEWTNIANYILNNPVKAGLVNDWREWEYSYFKFQAAGE